MNSENIVSDHLSVLGLDAERFPKTEMRIRDQKTPDFRVFQGDTLAFYCEVKELTNTDPLEAHCRQDGSGILGPQISDGKSAEGRIETRLQKAVQQFKGVNPHHDSLNVLAVVNRYDLTGPDILLELLRGFLTTDGGTRYNTTREFLRKRIEAVIWEIDLYWWLDAFGKTPQHRWLSPHATDSPTFLKLKSLFRMNEYSQAAAGERERGALMPAVTL